MSNQTVRDVYGNRPVEPTTLYLSKGSLPSPDPTLIYGLELEIENTGDIEAPRLFTVTEDGSLRNEGAEFITRPGVFTTMVKGVELMFNNNNLRTIKEMDGSYSYASNYSDRTSIHVHTNVQDLTMRQIATLCLLYQVFERLVFQFIGNDRDKNIFCVPWYETLLSRRTLKSFLEGASHKVFDWHKYTALNLCPMSTLGTVEWRHMHGHSDLERLTQWLQIIGAFFRASRTIDFDEALNLFLSLNSTSQYEMAFHRVFYDTPAIKIPNYREFVSQGVLDLKYDWLG